MKLTIITVCFNAEKLIRETVDSVVHQSYKQIEYLIIDGGSTDNTMNILKGYGSLSFLKIYSEPDFGIYNAMNRGIARATGDFIYFLNAGDVFADGEVLTNVSKYIKDKNSIYYGKVWCLHGDGKRELADFENVEGTMNEKLAGGYMPCHQAIFSPRKLLVSHYFNESYKIRADYEWLVYCVCKGVPCCSMPYIICNYDMSGMSGSFANKNELNEETQKIIEEYATILITDREVDKEYIAQAFKWKEMANKNHYIICLLSRMLHLKQQGIKIEKFFIKSGYKKIVIYGMGFLGQRFYDEMKESSVEIVGVVDKNSKVILDQGSIYSSVEDLSENADVIVITAITYFHEIKKEIRKTSLIPIISLEEVVNQTEA